jgi:transcriptional regulator with XRE-family HTH domain
MAEKQIYNAGYRDLIAHIKATREKLGMTQTQVAGQLGVGRSWVSKVETCDLALDLLYLIRLCRVYRLHASDMIELMGKGVP